MGTQFRRESCYPDWMGPRWVGEEEKSDSGGNGDVYRVQDATEQHPGEAAQKVLRRERFSRYARFKREVKVAAGLSHPHIVRVLDSYLPEEATEEAPPYFVMPWCDGGTFRKLIIDGTHKGDPIGAARAIRPIFEAVEFLHRASTFHRDIKPSNLLRDADGTPVLADFGLCFDLEDSDQLTLTPEVIGSLRYRAPEYVNGRLNTKDHGPGDVYSLGRVLWALIAGRHPDEGSDLNYPDHNLKRLFPGADLTAVQFLIATMTDPMPERRPRIGEALAELLWIIEPPSKASKGASGASRALAAFLATDPALAEARAREADTKSDKARIDEALRAGLRVLEQNEGVAELLRTYKDHPEAKCRTDPPKDTQPGEHEALAKQLGWDDIPEARSVGVAFYPGERLQRRLPMLIGRLSCAEGQGRRLRVLAYVYSRGNDKLHPTVAYEGKPAESSIDSANLVRTVSNLAEWLGERFLRELEPLLSK
jgi:serine/threonine protein kinase